MSKNFRVPKAVLAQCLVHRLQVLRQIPRALCPDSRLNEVHCDRESSCGNASGFGSFRAIQTLDHARDFSDLSSIGSHEQLLRSVVGHDPRARENRIEQAGDIHGFSMVQRKDDSLSGILGADRLIFRHLREELRELCKPFRRVADDQRVIALHRGYVAKVIDLSGRLVGLFQINDLDLKHLSDEILIEFAGCFAGCKEFGLLLRSRQIANSDRKHGCKEERMFDHVHFVSPHECDRVAGRSNCDDSLEYPWFLYSQTMCTFGSVDSCSTARYLSKDSPVS